MSEKRRPHNQRAGARNKPFTGDSGGTKARAPQDRVILILGAPGLVGAQVTRQIARELCPDLMVLASLNKSDFGDLVKELKDEMSNLAKELDRDEYSKIEFVEEAGNIFVRPELAFVSGKDLRESAEHRSMLYQDLFGPLSEVLHHSKLVEIINRYKPDVIIDCINTATGISYQDVDTGCKDIRKRLNQISESIGERNGHVPKDQYKALEENVEMLLISQSIPQIVRHIQLLHDAMTRNKTRLYIKVGTTGTGGMGLKIPYTHGEDKPSGKLMAKSSIGFAHTGLLFLMARTPDGPIVKEIKPGAMIGYKKVVYQELKRQRKFVPAEMRLARDLRLNLPPEEFEPAGAIKMVGIDTGENGFFARGEFEAVTSINQMEFVTPEEIAHAVILEIKGGNTGHDVISAIDGSVMPPSYRAGYLRGSAIESLRALEKDTNPHSVATGELGPPKLTKLLYEAHLLYSLANILDPANPPPKLQVIINQEPEEISAMLQHFLEVNKDLRNTIISIEIPILLMDGKTLLRGPRIKVPESASEMSLPITDDNIDKWADQGWVDLRPKNMERWQDRFEKMVHSAESIHLRGSAEITMEAYRSKEIRIGEVVGWIFNNEEKGYRIK